MGSAAMALRTLLAIATALALAVAWSGCGGGDSGDGAAARPSRLPGDGRPVVTLGTRTSTEQILLGQLYKQALEARGFRVRLKQNIGSTRIADAALRSGEIDLYPEYLGAAARALAHDGVALLARTPFENVDAVAVTPRLAAAHELRSIGDLRAVGRIRLGAEPELHASPSGLPGLARVYGLDDVVYAPLTDGLQYPALEEERIDAAIVRTTDGELAESDLVLLDDPRELFGFEPVVPVVATRALAAQGPAFAEALDAVSATLTTRAMQRLNAATAIEGRSPEDAARAFLDEHDLS
jgi:osmoprotectant transport system substrate-binding protein